jgi:hypothetical protein
MVSVKGEGGLDAARVALALREGRLTLRDVSSGPARVDGNAVRAALAQGVARLDANAR